MSCMSFKSNLLLHFFHFLLELVSLIPVSILPVRQDSPILLTIPSQFLTLDQQLNDNLLFLAFQHISDQLINPVNSIPSQISAVHHAQGLIFVDGFLQSIEGVCQSFESSSIDLQHLLIHLNSSCNILLHRVQWEEVCVAPTPRNRRPVSTPNALRF